VHYGNWGSVVPWDVGGAVSGVNWGCGASAGDEGEGKGDGSIVVARNNAAAIEE
jgi:hypothetical protein